MESKLYDEIIRIERNMIGNKKFRTDKYKKDYLETYKENLICEMSKIHKAEYGGAQGGEMKDGKYPAKMSSLRSSSAMTFNILGNDSIQIKYNQWFSAGRYTVEFEKKLPTLQEANSNALHMANLDAFLYNLEEKEAVLCEMKMTEWIFNTQGKLKDAYLDDINYIDSKASTVFINCADQIQNEIDNGKLKRYDAWQMFKHTLACFNGIASMPDINKMTLLNVVWEVPAESFITEYDNYYRRYQEEIEGFRIFRNIMMDPNNKLQELFLEKGVKFNIEYLPVRNFVGILKKNKEELDYLARYTFEYEEK